ncbi:MULTISPECIES: hypothetical protein [unclassified Acidovorax]|uniref:hypothetical protein n=1 Tax=unclassified Acidovorax TaxID=2684926 RepID=UPI001C486FF3|nr:MULTISPECIES: hypothetical protein [unclassified Acidovorax]MBV7428606.1 hypothetical protein [Acidovorax sp. sif0732]MBV7450432.1 hypothetical protein [Acidovorax sp. sif0715]
MNRSLARIHFGLSIFYGIGAALLCVIYLAGDNASGSGVLILAGIFGTPFVLHCAALRSVRSGHLWGRNLSRTLGILLLFAFPIGTVLGVLILMRTRRTDWEQGLKSRAGPRPVLTR